MLDRRRCAGPIAGFGYPCNELKLLLARALDQPFGDIALVGTGFSKQPATQERNGFAIIYIAWRHFHAQQFAAMVDGDMQLEAVEPSG